MNAEKMKMDLYRILIADDTVRELKTKFTKDYGVQFCDADAGHLPSLHIYRGLEKIEEVFGMEAEAAFHSNIYNVIRSLTIANHEIFQLYRCGDE